MGCVLKGVCLLNKHCTTEDISIRIISAAQAAPVPPSWTETSDWELNLYAIPTGHMDDLTRM